MEDSPFSKFSRIFNDGCPAVQYGILYTKSLERAKFLALLKSDKEFEARMDPPPQLERIFYGGREFFSDKTQQNLIRSGRFEIEIFSDASLSGWGASCNKIWTHGFWLVAEKQNHINYLELLAVFHALRCFTSPLRDCDVLVRVYNTTALSYINRMRSINPSFIGVG